jgi:prenyltransferase beta subunit
MLQVARLAPTLLQSSADLVGGFFRERYDAGGGFVNRAGLPDLYYTVFGLEGMSALRAPIDAARTRAYLADFGDGAQLDFVHLSCLARCWANLPEAGPPPDTRARLLDRLATYRTPDGGFNTDAGAADGTAYGAFVALGAYQDLKADVPDAEGLMRQLLTLTSADGALNNFPGAPFGLTTATAAGAAALRQFGMAVPPTFGPWLLAQAHPQGGFRALPGTPIPDLLSTATALHALVGLHADISALKEPCLDFVDSLWTNRGGFYGHWEDDVLDCEYTYYGLLALGHLSL